MSKIGSLGDRRPQNVALFGLFVQLAAFATLAGLAIWKDSDATATLARFVLTGVPIWFVLFLLFKQMRRVTAEHLETAELKRARAGGAAAGLFEVDEESLLLEQNRLRWMIQWLLPAATLVSAGYLLLGHFVAWNWTFQSAFAKEGVSATKDPTLVMWFIVGVGFLSFLYSRYTIALSRMPNWRPLRAAATGMAGIALTCLGLAIALMIGTTAAWAEPLYAYIVRVAMILLGIEFLANFVLDFYRPRHPGVVPRPSFESRFLSLIGEPGGIAKSIADAINYQFGFEVSSTWFYQLLQRWLFPIVVFTFVVVLSLSSIVIVEADEQVVVERFGSIVGGGEPLGSGVHLKWPYPIEIVYRAPVKRVREQVIGEATQKDDDDPRKAILWTESHEFVPEMMLLVASPKLTALSEGSTSGAAGQVAGGTESVPVSLLMISVPIEYRIKDLKKYLHVYRSPEQVMEDVAQQYLKEYGAGVDIDILMGPGRDELNRDLKARLQERLDRMETGIELVFAGIRGAHPPAKDGVAEAFLRVITAQTQKSATINAAEGEAQKILTAVAGTEGRARDLDAAIGEWEQFQTDAKADPEAAAQVHGKVDELLLGNAAKGIPPLSGEAAARIADSRVRAAGRKSDAASKVRAFKTEVVAYEAAPTLYKSRRELDIWAGLDSVRKYLIVGDPSNVIIEYETQQAGGLDQILTEGLEKGKN